MLKEQAHENSSMEVSHYIEGLLSYDSPTPANVAETKPESVNRNTATVSTNETSETYLSFVKISQSGKHWLVPANCISFVDTQGHDIVRLPNAAPAFKGIATVRDKSIAVVELMPLLEPGLNEVSNQVESSQVNKLLVMKALPYAIECDAVEYIPPLLKTDIYWNPSDSSNQYYSGIDVKQRLPILNISVLNEEVMSIPFVSNLQRESETVSHRN